MHRNSPLSVLLICHNAAHGEANTTLEHIDAFARYSRHRVFRFDSIEVRAASMLRLDLYDVIVVHHSIIPTMDEYLSRSLREKIAEYEGLKICFRQDEFSRIDATNAVLHELGVDVLFSVSGREAADRLYARNRDRVEIVQVLTGYVPEGATSRRRVPLSERPIDVGYRGRTLPYWLGRLSQEKAEIGRQFLARATGTGLACDIAWDERSRIYGANWTRFLESCRSMLGTEGGASIADFDASIERAVVEYLANRPDASFDEVHAAVLAPYEGNVVVTAISPRIFEAAAAWTPLVLFPGEYSGVVEPDRHYLPLYKDFSNFDGVVAALRDDARLDAMVERAHADLVASGRYSHRAFISAFDDVIEERAQRRPDKSASVVVAAAHAQALREQRLRVGMRRTLRATRATLTRLLTTSYLVVEQPSFRKLWRNYVDHPSLLIASRPDALFRDLLRLSLALRLAAGGLRGAFDSASGEVRLGSSEASSAGGQPTVALRTIVWEFDGTDDSVVCELPGGWRVVVPCRRAGEKRYRFAALEAHSRVASGRVWQALAPLISNPDRRDAS